MSEHHKFGSGIHRSLLLLSPGDRLIQVLHYSPLYFLLFKSASSRLPSPSTRTGSAADFFFTRVGIRAPGVGDAGIEALANGCPRLEAINLSYCSRITDNAMRSLSQLTALRQIEIRACPLVTSAGFALLSAGCKSLVNFDFKHCTGVGDDGISALVRGCPSIQQVQPRGLMCVAWKCRCN